MVPILAVETVAETGHGNDEPWIFTPDAAWKKGAYSIRVGTATADLAGNMIDRPFEIDVFERVDQNLNRSTRSLEFRVD